MTDETQQEQIEQAFLQELQALLNKYKVDIEVEEGGNGNWGSYYVEGISFEFDAIYGDESNGWEPVRPYWSLSVGKRIPYDK